MITKEKTLEEQLTAEELAALKELAEGNPIDNFGDKRAEPFKKKKDEEKDPEEEEEEEDLEEKVKYPHSMYDPDSGEEVVVQDEKEHEKYEKMGWVHEKPEEKDLKETIKKVLLKKSEEKEDDLEEEEEDDLEEACGKPHKKEYKEEEEDLEEEEEEDLEEAKMKSKKEYKEEEEDLEEEEEEEDLEEAKMKSKKEYKEEEDLEEEEEDLEEAKMKSKKEYKEEEEDLEEEEEDLEEAKMKSKKEYKEEEEDLEEEEEEEDLEEAKMKSKKEYKEEEEDLEEEEEEEDLEESSGQLIYTKKFKSAKVGDFVELEVNKGREFKKGSIVQIIDIEQGNENYFSNSNMGYATIASDGNPRKIKKGVYGKVLTFYAPGRPQDVQNAKKLLKEEELDETQQLDLAHETIARFIKNRKSMTPEDLKKLQMLIKKESVSESIEALIAADDSLSESFKSKAATLFEATIAEKVIALKEEYKDKLEEAIEKNVDTLTEKLDRFLSVSVEQWLTENDEGFVNKTRMDISESFIENLKSVFENHYINIPNSKVDLFDEISEKSVVLEEKLESATDKISELTEKLNDMEKEKIISEVSKGLVETDSAKLRTFAEHLDFIDSDSYENKLKIVKENFIVKNGKSERSEDLNESTSNSTNVTTRFEEDEHESDKNSVMGKYVEALSRHSKFAN